MVRLFAIVPLVVVAALLLLRCVRVVFTVGRDRTVMRINVGLSKRRSTWAKVCRAAIVVAVGLSTLAAVTTAASASSATTDTVSFSGATGSNGNYVATVTLSATPSDNSYTAIASDTLNSSTFTYTATGSSGCVLTSTNSGTVTFQSAGTCVITATATGTDKDQGKGTGDGNAAGATGTLTLTILPIPQTITFTTTPPQSPLVGATYTVSATASSGLPVQLTRDGSSTSGCTLDALTGTVTLTAPVGTCVIDANQLGDQNYAPAPQVQQVVTDALAAQTITLIGPNWVSVQYGATSTYQIQATDSSGVTIDYATSSSTCAVDATGLISGLGVGNCVVTLSAPGTSSVSAAVPVTFTLSVQSPPPPPPPPPALEPPPVAPGGSSRLLVPLPPEPERPEAEPPPESGRPPRGLEASAAGKAPALPSSPNPTPGS